MSAPVESTKYKLLLPKPDEGVTPRGWFVSEVLGGDRRTTHGTRDGFQSPKTLGEVGRWIKNKIFSPPPRPDRHYSRRRRGNVVKLEQRGYQVLLLPVEKDEGRSRVRGEVVVPFSEVCSFVPSVLSTKLIG